MTHDELLEKIGEAVGWEDKRPDGKTVLVIEYDDSPITKALRAVVELHKPVQGRSDISTYDYVGCDACVEWSHDGNMNLRYPCPTIQAIEKELG